MAVRFNPWLGGNLGFHTFTKDISLKEHAIARLGFERTYYDVIVQHFSHYTPGNRSNVT